MEDFVVIPNSERGEFLKIMEENVILRGLLGNSSKDCPYCGLPAKDQGRCAYGFPGCPRADDQSLGEYFVAGYERDMLKEEVSRLKELCREPQDFVEEPFPGLSQIY